MSYQYQTETGNNPAAVLEDVQRLLTELVEKSRSSDVREPDTGQAPSGRSGVQVLEVPTPPGDRWPTTIFYERKEEADWGSPDGYGLQLPTVLQVRHQIRQREVRESVFETGLISDPIWGIMLELLLAHLEGRQVSVKAATIASGVPAATAHGHIDRLEGRKLLRRYPDPFDGRRKFLTLTDDALRSLARLFAKLQKGPTPAV